MQKIVSKKDNREYYLCKASEAAEYTYFTIGNRNVSLYGTGKYQVRKSETPGYVVFNGTIWDDSESLKSLLDKSMPFVNGYNGTNIFGAEIPASVAKEIFTYID